MIYYRLASQKRYSTEWEWKSSAVGSLEALFRLSLCYPIPAEKLRVFQATLAPYLDVLLVRENRGLPSHSLTLDQLFHQHCGQTTPQMHLIEMELGLSGETAHGKIGQAVRGDAEPQPGQEPASPAMDAVDGEPGRGDHHVPYTFAFPQSLPQAIAWMRLRERVLAGELVP